MSNNYNVPEIGWRSCRETALRSNTGASFALIEAARNDKASLMATVPLCFEYESVCHRPEHRQAAGLTSDEVDIFLDAIVDLINPVEVFFLWRPQLRDPGDELVLEAAVASRADAIVSFNVRDYVPAARFFNMDVILPKDALRRLR